MLLVMGMVLFDRLVLVLCGMICICSVWQVFMMVMICVLFLGSIIIMGNWWQVVRLLYLQGWVFFLLNSMQCVGMIWCRVLMILCWWVGVKDGWVGVFMLDFGGKLGRCVVLDVFFFVFGVVVYVVLFVVSLYGVGFFSLISVMNFVVLYGVVLFGGLLKRIFGCCELFLGWLDGMGDIKLGQMLWKVFCIQLMKVLILGCLCIVCLQIM